MIPRSPTPFLLACLLSPFAQGHATTIDDFANMVVTPYLEDSVFGSVVGPSASPYGMAINRGFSSYDFEWTVLERDVNGRPVLATDAQRDPSGRNPTQYLFYINYSWGIGSSVFGGFPERVPFRNWGVGYLPLCPGCTFWPQHVKFGLEEDSRGVGYHTEGNTWDSTARSVFSSREYRGSCPNDSIVFDALLRPILQAKCTLLFEFTDQQTPLLTSMHLHYDNSTDWRPRWTSEQSEDTSEWIDSVHYVGPTSTPTHMRISHRKGGNANTEVTTRTDSLSWDEAGRLLSRLYDVESTSSSADRKMDRYIWVSGRLKSATSGIYRGSDLSTPISILTSYTFEYGTRPSSVEPRTARTNELRRSANGRIVVPRRDTSPVQVEWTALDGRRENLAIVPEGEGAISVAAPRGVGILRVTQDGHTKVHPIANF